MKTRCRGFLQLSNEMIHSLKLSLLESYLISLIQMKLYERYWVQYLLYIEMQKKRAYLPYAV